MKRIIAFLLLLCTFVVILTLPTVAAPAASPHAIPMWSVLCYLIAVGIGGFIAFGMCREQEQFESEENTVYQETA